MVEDLLAAHPSGRLVHYCSPHAHRRANSACLLGCFAVIVLGRDARAAYAPFVGVRPPLQPYRDAAFGVCTYPLLVLDVVRGVRRALALGHLDYRNFDVDECVGAARGARARARALFSFSRDVGYRARLVGGRSAEARSRVPLAVSAPPRALSGTRGSTGSSTATSRGSSRASSSRSRARSRGGARSSRGCSRSRPRTTCPSSSSSA